MPTEASERRLVLVSRYAQRDAATIGASHPEFVLRDGMAPLCGFAVPSDGYSVILRDAFDQLRFQDAASLPPNVDRNTVMATSS